MIEIWIWMFSGFEILVTVESTQLSGKIKKDFKINFRIPIFFKKWHNFVVVWSLGRKEFSSSPVAGYLWEETNPQEATAFFQVLVERSSEPPSLRAKHHQLPQTLLGGFIFQTLHQPGCPSLDMLQHCNVLPKLKGQELDTALEVQPHQCQV